MNFSKALIAIAALAAAAFASATAGAAEWPTKPVRLVIGFAPGGGTDTTARALANKMGGTLGQQIIVDNRPGHSGTIAADIVSKGVPDGHTVLLGTIALVINPHLAKMPFDTFKDLMPVTQAVDSTNILIVHPSLPVKSVTDLVNLAKTKPLNGIREDGDQGAFVEEGFEEDAVDGGGDFEGGLVGLDLGDYVAGGDLLAFVFDPAADQALLDCIAEFGRLYGGCHYL